MALAISAHAQQAPYKYDLGGGIGMSGYLGDACSTPVFKHPGFAAEVGARYIHDVRWAFRGVLGLQSLSGSTQDIDSYIPGVDAPISFKSTVYSLQARAEFNFLPYGIGETYKKLSRVTPYLALGLGAALASSSGKSAFGAEIPMAFGVKYKINKRLNLIGEFSMTKIFSDKVDGPLLSDLTGIRTNFFKDTDWVSLITVGLTFEFGERCETCNYVE